MPDPITDPTPTPTPTPTPKTPDLTKAAESLVSKHGDPTAALLVLLGENYTLRDKSRELSAKLPPEGSVVLSGDHVKDWNAYQGLGKVSDLRKALEEGTTAKTDATRFRKAATLSEVAEVSGLSPKVLAGIAGVDALEFEFEDVKGKDGKSVRTAFVKGEADSRTPIADYAEAHWGAFLPVLKPESDGARPRTPGTPRAPSDRPPTHAASRAGQGPNDTPALQTAGQDVGNHVVYGF